MNVTENVDRIIESHRQQGWDIERNDDVAVLLKKKSSQERMPKTLGFFQALLLGLGIGTAISILLRKGKH